MIVAVVLPVISTVVGGGTAGAVEKRVSHSSGDTVVGAGLWHSDGGAGDDAEVAPNWGYGTAKHRPRAKKRAPTSFLHAP